MAYLITCLDRKNSLSLRLETRDEHIKYLKKIGRKLVLAGPILDKNSNPKGTVLILDYKDENTVKEFLKNDPYNVRDLFESVKIIKFKKVL